MKFKQLSIEGVAVFEPVIHEDERGSFHEWFKLGDLKYELDCEFNLYQANCSTSRRGTLRGIHFAKNPPGQRKYLKCVAGTILDVVIDLRINSNTFGKWESIELSAANKKSIFIPNGIGHAFLALEDNTTVVYLCDQEYSPENEFEINPLDKEIGITWPAGIDFKFSQKDLQAPSLKESMPLLSSFKL